MRIDLVSSGALEDVTFYLVASDLYYLSEFVLLAAFGLQDLLFILGCRLRIEAHVFSMFIKRMDTRYNFRVLLLHLNVPKVI